ncbi:MAG: sulfate permease [Polyangiales bacterium]
MADTESFRPSDPLAGARAAPATAENGFPPTPEKGLYAYVPGLWVLRNYRKAWLWDDLVAGLVVSSVLVPAGMGYAVAAGLPPITGLYATIVPLLAYAVFGPSRIMVLGPDSGLAALIAATVVAASGGDDARAIALASMLAILTGLLCAVAALARVGFLTDLLSKPVRVGYMNGIALTVFVAQLPKLFGFSVHASGVYEGSVAFAHAVLEGRTHPIALAIGGGSLALILGLRALVPRFPAILAAVVLATAGVTMFDLSSDVAVVGAVPRGLPLPSLPRVGADDLLPLFVSAIGIALVSFAETSVLSRTVAARNGYRVDSSRELFGIGLANFAAGFFQGFPISSSSSRTPVAESAGSRTQVTGVVGALVITLLLVAAPGLMRNLPTTALAAVVIAAAIRLVDVRSLRVFWHVRRTDLALSLLAFLAVASIGVLQGIGLAVAVSILDFLRRAWRPHDAVLGRAHAVKGYHDVERYPAAKQVPGLVLYRWDAPLFFANAELFRERVIELVDGSATPVKWVVIAAEPITDVDTTAAEMLQELEVELAVRGIELAVAEMKDPVKDRLKRYGLVKRIGAERFFPTIGVAVKAYRETNAVDFTDWEEGTISQD